MRYPKCYCRCAEKEQTRAASKAHVISPIAAMFTVTSMVITSLLNHPPHLHLHIVQCATNASYTLHAAGFRGNSVSCSFGSGVSVLSTSWCKQHHQTSLACLDDIHWHSQRILNQPSPPACCWHFYNVPTLDTETSYQPCTTDYLDEK